MMSAAEVVAQRWVWIIDWRDFTVHQFHAERAHGEIIVGWLQDQATTARLSNIWATKGEAEQVAASSAEVNVPILERQLAGATHAISRVSGDEVPHGDEHGYAVG